MLTLTGASLRTQREHLGLSQARLAELTGLPQHQLSAFELGKLELPPEAMETLTQALSDDQATRSLSSRRKRYRNHEYRSIQHLFERVERAQKTPGNEAFLAELSELAAAHARPKCEGLTAISLFSGCGGLSLGFSAAGFEVKGYLEVDAGARQIYRANFPSSRQLGAAIEEIDSAAFAEATQELGEVDVLIGGPPCQGFSLAGKRHVTDQRNTLFRHYLRVVDALKPKVAVLENVRLLTSMKSESGSLVKNDILDAFRSHGYKVKLFEVNARNYGVPQHRDRVFFVAVREDVNLSPSFPLATHGSSGDLFGDTGLIRTFGDACSDLAFLESGESSLDPLHRAVRHPSHVIDWLWDVPEGASAHENHDPANRPPSGYNTTYKRQVWSEPGATVQTTFGMISGCRNVHPIATRSLTIREAARLQSFPDSFAFPGTQGAIRTSIGNAVPPLLAYRIGLHLRSLLLDLVEVPGL